MSTLSRMTAGVVCAAVLLLALPAQAAPPPPSHSAQLSQVVSQWLDSVRGDLSRLFTVRPGPKGHKPLQPKGGSCLDPNGVYVCGGVH